LSPVKAPGNQSTGGKDRRRYQLRGHAAEEHSGLK
jgi:hypothetical protein